MARSDLLVGLVTAVESGDSGRIRATVNAIITDERSKQHHILADKLEAAISQDARPSPPRAGLAPRGRELPDAVQVIYPKRQLDQIFLEVETRNEVEGFLEEHERSDVLQAFGILPRHRIMLIGPPGTGKTSLAEAIADSLAMPLIKVRYDLLIGSFLGETASRLGKIFEYASQQPCVLLLDEFDAIGKERDDDQELGEIKRVASSLLTLIESTPSHNIIVAATNHPHLLDSASWRRFEVILHLPNPDRNALHNYLRQFFDTFPDVAIMTPYSFAEVLEGSSYADLEMLCLDIKRKYVLGMPTSSLQDIAERQIELRRRQADLVRRLRVRGNNGRTSTYQDSAGNSV